MAAEKASNTIDGKKIPTSESMRNQARENMKNSGLNEQDMVDIRSGKMKDPEKIMKANKAWAEANPSSPLAKYIKRMDVNFKDSAETAVKNIKDMQAKLGLGQDGIVGLKTSLAWNKRLELSDQTKEKVEAESILNSFDGTFNEDTRRYTDIQTQLKNLKGKQNLEGLNSTLSQDGMRKIYLDRVVSNGIVDYDLAVQDDISIDEAKDYLLEKNIKEKPGIKKIFDTIALFEQTGSQYIQNVKAKLVERVRDGGELVESDWDKSVRNNILQEVARSVIDKDKKMSKIPPDQLDAVVKNIDNLLNSNPSIDFSSLMAAITPKKEGNIAMS